MNPSPGTEVRIRRMAPADLDQMMELALSLEHAPHWPRSAYAVALDPEAAPRRITLIAETPLSGVILGFAVASLLPPQAELETIAVATKWQRRGVARRILTAMTEELRTAMITEVLLEVRASNSAALAFYRTLGFAIAGRRPLYYADPIEDAVLMELSLA
jgi:ribosomal-protein-alanine N-acetyltransferase